MIDVQESVKKLVGEAHKEGIDLEDIRGYLKLTKIPKDKDKETMDRLYQENSVYPWDLAFFRDVDSIIENVNNERAAEEILIVDEIENKEEKALTIAEENVFSKLGKLFANMWKSIKTYVNEMQVLETKLEEVNVLEEGLPR